VHFLLTEMRYQEILGWFAYLEQRPVGWRSYEQTYAFLQTQGVKEKAWDIFPVLKAIYQPVKVGSFDLRGFKGSVLFQKIQSAKGGETLDYEQLEKGI